MSFIILLPLCSNLTANYLTDQSKSNLDKATAANQQSFIQGTLDATALNIVDDTLTERLLIILGDLFYSIFFIVFVVAFKVISWKNIQAIL